jgi:hypothetical protein
MTRFAAAVLPALALVGCTTSLGALGVMRPEREPIDVKLLRPGVTGRSCSTSIVGVRVSGNEPTVREALDQIMALDSEGNVVVDADVTLERFVTGLYNRRCIAVRGDLARMIPTLTLQAPEGHHHH